jgi:hypothetical protein
MFFFCWSDRCLGFSTDVDDAAGAAFTPAATDDAAGFGVDDGCIGWNDADANDADDDLLFSVAVDPLFLGN